jgi:hypothetical protein
MITYQKDIVNDDVVLELLQMMRRGCHCDD